MSVLFPRMASFAPMRHEFAPFVNLFNDTFSELSRISDTYNTQRSFTPKFDVKEAKDAYHLEGELPGILQKDLSIEFSDDQTLTVKGRTESSREEGQRPQAITAAATEENGILSAKATESKDVTTTPAQQTTSVAKTGEHEHPQHTYWVSERSQGEFARSFSFPVRVDQDGVKASLKNGILSITVPKMVEVRKSRTIQIADGE